MCYERKGRGLDEETRRPRAEEDRRTKAGSENRPVDGEREKTLTEKAKEMVGAR